MNRRVVPTAPVEPEGSTAVFERHAHAVQDRGVANPNDAAGRSRGGPTLKKRDRLVGIALLAAAYVFTARMGLSLDAVEGVATVVWPPTGISIAALTLFGRALWPGVACGAFIVGVGIGIHPLAVAGICVGNTLEALMGAYALRSSLGSEGVLRRLSDVWRFVLVGVAASALVCATIGTAFAWMGGAVPEGRSTTIWLMWWFGNGMGALVFAPIFLVWQPRPSWLGRPRWAFEALTCAAFAAIVFALAFGVEWGAYGYSGKYVVFPAVIWSALRFGQPGATLSSVLISFSAIYLSTEESQLPLPLHERLAVLQLFLAVVAITALVVGAMATEREAADARQRDLLATSETARSEAEAANRGKDEFLAIVSHELRTPITPILMWSSLLRSNKVEESDVGRALEVIEGSARVQARLVDDLLDVSRIVSGKLQLNMQAIDLLQVIAAAVESLRPAADHRGIRIDVDAPRATVLGDAARLQQVIWNLLSNGVKFTPKGGRIDVRVRETASCVEITVSDTGTGIPPGFLPRIFGRFQQADYAITRQHGGLGLGLAIVKHLVELHGGRVRAESDGPGKGSTFTVEIPRISPEASMSA